MKTKLDDDAIDVLWAGKLLRKSDVAELMDVSEWSVTKWMDDGKLRFIRIGGTVRFRVEDVREFVERHQSEYGVENNDAEE